MRIRRVRRARIVAGVACLALLTLGAVALATAVSGGDPTQPTSSTSPLLSIGQPITPYRAGDPAEGWIEMRARNLGGPGQMAVLYHTFTRNLGGRPRRHVCAEVGGEQQLRRYPVRDGGSCRVIQPGIPPSPLGFGVTSMRERQVMIHGQASAEVRRLVVAGPGGTYEVPLSRHRAFVLLYGDKARGTATLTAHLRDGSTRFFATKLPPDVFGRGKAEARDPGGRPPWQVSASLRARGARKGQTCAQFGSAMLPGRRASLEFGAPMCGDLSRHPLFADATRYGPRAQQGSFGPGPRSPKRLIVWGAVAGSVREVRIAGPDGTRRLALSPLGRAFLAVYPGSVSPQEVTLELTLADGTVERQRAPRRLNAIALAAQPRLAEPRIGLRTSRSDPSKLVLTSMLTLPAKRFEVTLQGREVRMRRSGGSDRRPRYTGIYDRDRGVRRMFVAGRSYPASVVLCGADGCVPSRLSLRLR